MGARRWLSQSLLLSAKETEPTALPPYPRFGLSNPTFDVERPARDREILTADFFETVLRPHEGYVARLQLAQSLPSHP